MEVESKLQWQLPHSGVVCAVSVCNRLVMQGLCGRTSPATGVAARGATTPEAGGFVAMFS